MMDLIQVHDYVEGLEDLQWSEGNIVGKTYIIVERRWRKFSMKKNDIIL